MRIVIDGQGAQTASRFRGIGRYSLGFIEAVAKAASGHEVILALNGMLTESIIPIRRRLHGILPAENIKVWHSIGPTRESLEGTERNRALALAVRREFIESLQPDVFHITSLFEGFVDDAAVEGKWRECKFVQTAALYDLIPLLFSDEFLNEPHYRRHYNRALSELLSFDSLLAISRQSEKDAGNVLQVPAGFAKYVGIGFNAEDLATSLRDRGRAEASTVRDCSVLIVAGDDAHKNIDFVPTALKEFSKKLKSRVNLVFVGKLSQTTKKRLRDIATKNGLPGSRVKFLGYVEDSELINLYKTAGALVMPSKYEGFGLPVLEAMAHGLPVAVSNRGALPEVVGRSDITFDPDTPVELARLLENLLFDREFQEDIIRHGLERSKEFSWDDVADRALAIWEDLVTGDKSPGNSQKADKKRVAIVSPLPPDDSGIADFTVDILPVLSEGWEITLIHPSARNDGFVGSHSLELKRPQWLLDNWQEFDFVLYMFGNSPHHNYSYELLKRVPGIVVLHDVFLSSFFHWRSTQAGLSRDFERALVETHGVRALCDLVKSPEIARDLWQANWPVLKRAKGVVVHSKHARDLLVSQESGRLPPVMVAFHPKAKVMTIDKLHAREKLGISESAFVVASFGGIADTKCSREVVAGFHESKLGQAREAVLFLVGALDGGRYGQELREMIESQGTREKVQITGFVSAEEYELYMAASDFVIQLRTKSRGESSGALAGCLARGLPALINRHGSFAEVPENVAKSIPDDFSLRDLIKAFDEMFSKPKLRDRLARNSVEYSQEKFVGPKAISEYAAKIEQLSEINREMPPIFTPMKILELNCLPREPDSLSSFAQRIASTFSDRRARTLFIDVTGSKDKAYVSGIERVVSELTDQLLSQPPSGFSVEPIYLDNVGGKWLHRRATNFSLGQDGAEFEEPVIDVFSGDVIIFADLAPELTAAANDGLLDHYRRLGANLVGLVYDILPITEPEFFPPGMGSFFADWLDVVLDFDGVIGISETTARAVVEKAQRRSPKKAQGRGLWVDSFQLGTSAPISPAGIGGPEFKVPDGLLRIVMLGTVEPRKGYWEVLDAFEILWGEGHKVQLTIIGREGWTGLPENQRGNVPETVRRMERIEQASPFFHWIRDADDQVVNQELSCATGLIAASYAEGYGLPVVEALSKGTPVLARDIGVFREFSGPGVSFFETGTPEQLANQILRWVREIEANPGPMSANDSVLTWGESATQFCEVLFRNLSWESPQEPQRK